MPRQPFFPFLQKNLGGRFDVGTHALRQRPALELLIANCLMAWPPAEAEMAVLLAYLLGAQQSEAALAVFHTLRRSTAQREAISEAARTSLISTDRELLNAILNVHKSVESERNALTHGHFGIYTKLTDGIIWMDTKTYVDAKTHIELIRQPMNNQRLENFYSSVYIYKKSDLETIFGNIKDIADIWGEFIFYLRAVPSKPRAELYHQLCDRPRIGQELEKLRRENILPSPPE